MNRRGHQYEEKYAMVYVEHFQGEKEKSDIIKL